MVAGEVTRMPRIAIGGFHHETNTFAPFPTSVPDFEKADGWPGLTEGDAVIEVFRPLNIPIGGFIATAPDFELVPLLWTAAEPAAAVSRDAYERIADRMCGLVQAAMPLDGVFLDLHGAMVAEHLEDGEGELLARLRAVVGAAPIVLCLDMHANVTRAMAELSDAIVVYRTYPHVDLALSGQRAAMVMRQLLTGRPSHSAMRKIDVLLPMPAQGTDSGPIRELFAGLEELRSDALLSADIALGFPLADIEECGPSVVVCGWDAQAVAEAADALAAHAKAVLRLAPIPEMLPPGEAVSRARVAARPGLPAMLVDAQDNPGCGGTSDEVTLLQALVAGGARNAAIGMIYDPAAAEAAHHSGTGTRLRLDLGGKLRPGASPLAADYEVMALHSGDLIGSGAIFGGVRMELGRMARLRVVDAGSEVDALLCSARFQLMDQALLRCLGVEPRDLTILALKSTIHWRADFAGFAAEILYVDAPGAAPCGTATTPFRRLRPGVLCR